MRYTLSSLDTAQARLYYIIDPLAMFRCTLFFQETEYIISRTFNFVKPNVIHFLNVFMISKGIS